MDWLNYENLRMKLNEFMPSLGDSFVDIFKALLQGDSITILQQLPELCREIVAKTIDDFGSACFVLLLLGLMSAVSSRLSQVFKERSMSEAASCLCYLSAAGLLISIYYTMVETALTLINVMVGFTEVLIPIFYLAVAMTRQIQTAAGFYQMNLLLLYAVEVIIPEIIVPLVSVYIYLSILSGITGEDLFGGFIGLLKKILTGLQKSSLLVIGGAGIMKKMLHGATDGMNLAVWQKTLGAIPAFGDLSDGVTGILLGSSVLIRNGLGITFLIVMVLLVAVPVGKLLLLSFFLHIIASAIAVFGEKKFALCIQRVAAGSYMLLKTCICCISIFMVVVALVCVAV